MARLRSWVLRTLFVVSSLIVVLGVVWLVRARRQAEADDLAEELRSAVVEGVRAHGAELTALKDRLTFAARRADVELDRSPKRPPEDVLREIATAEQLRWIYLLDARGNGFRFTVDPRLPGPEPGTAPYGEAIGAISDITRGDDPTMALWRSTFDHDRGPVIAISRAAGGYLALHPRDDELADVRRRMGVDSVLTRVRSNAKTSISVRKIPTREEIVLDDSRMRDPHPRQFAAEVAFALPEGYGGTIYVGLNAEDVWRVTLLIMSPGVLVVAGVVFVKMRWRRRRRVA